jgi:hypothetical protein
MRFALYTTLAYAWFALFLALLVGGMVWIGASAMDPPEPNEDGMGAFPSPMLLVIIASLVTFVVAFVGAFFRTLGWTLFIAVVLTIVAYVAIIVLDWVLGTWGSVILLLAIPAALGLVVGIVMFLLIVKRSEIGVWLTAGLLVAFVATLWLALELESPNLYLGVFLFNVMIVVTLVGYKALVTIFQLYKKWTTGAW